MESSLQDRGICPRHEAADMLPGTSRAAPLADPAGSTSAASSRTPDERDEANWAPSDGSTSSSSPPPFCGGDEIDAAWTIGDGSDSDRERDSLSPINQRHDADQAGRLLFRLDVATPTIQLDGPGAFLASSSERVTRSSGGAASTLFSRSKKSASLPSQAPRTPRTPRTTPRRKRDDNVVVALVHGRGFARQDVGLAAVNLTSCELRLSQMNDSQTYTKTLAKLNLYRPVEVLMPDTIVCAEPVSSLVKRINEFDSEIVITALERSAFNESKGIDCVTQLSVTDPSILHVVLEQKFYALAAAAALVHHLERNANVSFAPKTLRISYQGTDQTVLIDSETALRLELVCSLDETGNGPSLLSSIDYCRTSAGTRMLRSNLLEPFSDPGVIESRLDAVEELVERPLDLYQPIKENLSRFVDVERVIKQCVVVPRRTRDGKQLSGEFIEQRINAVIGLRHVLTLVRPLRAALEQAKSALISQLGSELANNPVMDRVLERINQVLEDKAKPAKGKIGMKRQRLNAIKTGADLMLDVCRQTYNQLESELEDYVAEMVVKYRIPLTLAHTASRGYHLQQTIPRPKKRDNNPTARLPAPVPPLPPVFICIKRQGNCVAFTTQHLLVANERLKSVQKDAEQLTDTIIEQLLTEIRQDVASLYKLREIVCQLDVLASFATYALNAASRPKSSAYDDESGGYCRPKLGAHATLIRSGRHPILNHHSPETLVSNDTDMNEQYHFHVITGAHMSGKSTYIRQVMLLQILAQIGSFVPAKSATFRLVDQMFSRLGTQDRFGNNASSFSLEMMEMNYIVRNAGPRSLVILDELCQSTSRQEGSALCWSLCEDLLELGAWVLITTHTPFITRLGDIYGPVVNYHMQVVETTSPAGRPSMHFTHKILAGTCLLEHYGMKLAKMVAFPEEIVQRAEELLPLFDARMKLTLPKVPLEGSLNKLNYDLYCRVKDLDARIDSLADDIAKLELDRILKSYTEELSRIIAQHECGTSPSSN